MELYFDKEGVLVSTAQYFTTVDQKKKVMVGELNELKTRLEAFREQIDRFHELEVANSGRLKYETREKYRVVREKHGKTYRNIMALQTLMGKWMYV